MKDPKRDILWRVYLIYFVLVSFALAIVGKVIYIQFAQGDELMQKAKMARFADQRTYYYKGSKIDEKGHFGMDLASLPNSEIQAANNGRVIFADRLGIYGLAVVLDHGQGISSIYGHMSKINVSLHQEVKKGDVIGFTGQTGLAAGDHLHFGIMISGIFVDPIEWFDGHWVNDNITRKLAMVE